MYKVFIDGKEGTTGLEIFNRFAHRTDVEIITISDELRKNTEAKRKIINQADFVFLCLPDAAAIESVALVENPNVKVIDASTAHRINPKWAYGFAELSSQHREKIANSHRVAVGGCYASGFISLCYPLVAHGLIEKDHAISSYGISGYSGGGKNMISEYTQYPEKYTSPRFYALTQNHKHLPEMQHISGLSHPPVFNPIVDDFYNGMVVSIPLHVRTLSKKMTARAVHEVFDSHYQGQKLLKVMPYSENPPTFMDVNTLANTSKMELYIYGNEDQILLCSRFDNLGKGASGSAVQCMNIMMNIDETTGL